MAADTVDEVVRQLGHGARRSPTKHLQLLGAPGTPTLQRPGAAERLGVDDATLAHLVGRYGSEARTVAAMVKADPDLAKPLVPGLPYLRAEAVYAARYEMAHTLDDVLARRTRSLLFGRDTSARAATDVAQLIGEELRWSRSRIQKEVDSYRAGVVHARESAGLPEVGD